MAIDINNWTPMYIRQVSAMRPGQKVTADRWNELWNLSITQNDYHSETLEVLVPTTIDAQEKAVEAVAIANEANATANEAKTIAEQANSTADEAWTAASNAEASAARAEASASDAQDQALQAREAAIDAQTKADTASEYAGNAAASAENAENAQIAATIASEKSTEALTKAATAEANAAEALTTANGIDGKATEALQKAGTAETNAATALGNSQTALSLVANKEDKLNKGIPNGYASLNNAGKVPLSQMDDSILGSLTYKGLWNAATNTPPLSNSMGKLNDFYIVVAPGTQMGIEFFIGDWVIKGETVWDRVPNTSMVQSVQGRTGNVVITAEDVDLYIVQGVGNSQQYVMSQASVTAALTSLQDEIDNIDLSGYLDKASFATIAPEKGFVDTSFAIATRGIPITTDILTLPIGDYKCEGVLPDGYNWPELTGAYAYAYVKVRALPDFIKTNSRVVECYFAMTGNIYYNMQSNQSWRGWKRHVKAAGDTMTGNFTIQTSSAPQFTLIGGTSGNRKAMFRKNASDSVQGYTDLWDYNEAGNYVGIRANANAATAAEKVQVNDNGTLYPLYHTGNPPSAKKCATVVVGTTTAGHTLSDCDYLCTGSSDQTIINNAITASGGGKVVLRKGTYNINGSITLTANCTLSGESRATVIKSMFTGVSISAGSDSLVENLTVEYTGPTGTDILPICVRISSRAVADNVRCYSTVKSPMLVGIHVMSGSYQAISNCVFTGMATGLYVGRTEGTGPSNVTITNCSFSSTVSMSVGIAVYYSTYCTITGCTILVSPSGSNGILLYAGASHAVTGCTISTTASASTAAVSYALYINASCNNAISGNTIRGEFPAGIYLMGSVLSATDNMISGNTIINFKTAGVHVTSGSKSTSVVGNIIRSSVSTASNSFRVESGATYTWGDSNVLHIAISNSGGTTNTAGTNKTTTNSNVQTV